MGPEHGNNAPMLQTRGLGIIATSTVLLQDVELRLEAGDLVALTGETGAGKSTLLDALAGMSPHHLVGQLEVLGEDGPAAVSRLRGGPLGVLRQDIRGWYTPYRRVGTQVMEAFPGDSAAGAARVREVMTAFALPPERAWRRFPNQLSDGMLRRAALAALLARKPRLILADEPTAGLDGPSRWRAWELLIASGAAVVAATHDLDILEALAGGGRGFRVLEIRDKNLGPRRAREEC